MENIIGLEQVKNLVIISLLCILLVCEGVGVGVGVVGSVAQSSSALS